MAEVIVLEKQPRWAPELQRQFSDQTVVVRACRDVASLRERVTAALSSEKNCVGVLDPAGWAGEDACRGCRLSGYRVARTVAAGIRSDESCSAANRRSRNWRRVSQTAEPTSGTVSWQGVALTHTSHEVLLGFGFSICSDKGRNGE